MKKIILLLLVLLTGCGAAASENTTATTQNKGNQITSKEATIYIASDLHYLSNDLHDNGKAFETFTNGRDGKEIKYIDALVDAFIAKVKVDKPNVLVLSGDLTVNGELLSHQDFAEKLSTIDQNVTKIYTIPGNHDINNVYARSFNGDKQQKTDYVSSEKYKTIYYPYGLSNSQSRDNETLSYLVKPTSNLWIMMIDCSKYKSNVAMNTSQAGGVLQKGTLEWIRKCAEQAKAANATLVSVTHQNMLVHNEFINKNFTIDNGDQLFNILKEFNIKLNFSGHIHMQNIAEQEGIYDVASGALSVQPHNYGILKFSNNKLNYQTAKLNVDKWAKANGITDENLLNYSKYSMEKFYGTIGKMDVMDVSGDYTEQQKKEMADTLAELNVRYFSGEQFAESEIVNKEGYKLLLKQEGFLPNYVKSIAYSNGIDNNKLTVELNKQTQ